MVLTRQTEPWLYDLKSNKPVIASVVRVTPVLQTQLAEQNVGLTSHTWAQRWVNDATLIGRSTKLVRQLQDVNRYKTPAVNKYTTQQTRDSHPLLVQCWSSVYDAGPTLNQQWANVSSFAKLRLHKE